ncbi:J domain-containing protein 1 [Talaromyces marneffei ATCC 18224]|nr:hypothetical protein EYB25_001942 [Talaromyces marneffei]
MGSVTSPALYMFLKCDHVVEADSLGLRQHSNLQLSEIACALPPIIIAMEGQPIRIYPQPALCIEPTAPYSKRRYYELVKIYHPDLQNEDRRNPEKVSDKVRLQRYRLIVAAHEILSNPEKRAAYDRDGTGWHSHPDHPESKLGAKNYAYAADNDSSIFNNATWEDWERFHNRNKPKQVQMVSHGTFISFILLLVLFGGFAQASWITQTQLGLDQRVQEMNAKSARLLAKRRQQTDELKSREHRVQSFLIRRDPTGYGLKEEEEPVYKQALDKQARLPAPKIALPSPEGQPK